MKKFIFYITIFFCILNLYAKEKEEYILIKGKANSFKNFNKKYIKLKKLIKTKKFKIIKNKYHHFNNSNKFSYFIFQDPYKYKQNWINLINAENFYNISTGEHIKIGILDSGVELDHEDLNGQIVDYFNVADNTKDITDYIGHGTSVIGIMAAKAFNDKGIIGLSPKAEYIVAKISHYDEDTFDDYSVAKAIYYLVDKGCKIINMSIQMNYNSEIVEDAINYAKEKKVILVASSGNGINLKEYFPASNSYVLGVGSVDENYYISDFCSYDNDTFIFSVGENIFTTYINNSYIFQTGTSFAAPMLTSLIADILSLNSYLTYEDIKKIIKYSSNILEGNRFFKIINFINSLKSTGLQITTNKNIYFPGDSLILSLKLPPMTQNFNIYFGVITPDENIFMLKYINNDFIWELVTEKITPTVSNISLFNFLNITIFGENGIFPTFTINNISSGDYKFCGIYEKNNNFLGWLNCKSILIVGK